MTSKRYKALPQETKKLMHNTIENLLRTVKKIVQQSLMSQLTLIFN